MSIDDKLEVSRKEIETEVQFDVQRDVKAMMVASLLSAFPVGGAAIQSLLDGRAQRRVHERFLEMLNEMKARLEAIKESIPDEEFFASEEFQTLLALAFEQLQTAHDANKRKALAAALANSGSTDFSKDEQKEQFVRVLRDLSGRDLITLKDQRLKGWTPFVADMTYGGDVLSSLSRLEGLGLVMQTMKPSSGPFGRHGSATQELQTALQELLTKPPARVFHISGFGERFLKFIGTD
jgi:hypothetical protein